MLRYFILLLCLLALAGCQTMPRVTRGGVEVETDDARFQLYFTDHERDMIHEYYRGDGKHKKYKHAPPGLAKKEHLPPGLQKQLERKGTLPPGLQGRVLPMGLERKMHSLPAGYSRVIVGSDIVLMNNKTRVILDVILDAVLD